MTSMIVAETEHLDLAIISFSGRVARCRVLGSDRIVSLRARDVSAYVPGEVVTVRLARSQRVAGSGVTGDIIARRIDVAALGLVPLRLEAFGAWDPAEEYWGEEGEPLDAWAQELIADGPRPLFEMEQVLPGTDPEDPDDDPICAAADLNSAGRRDAAREILMGLLAQDLRCLDAHAHLGNFAFPRAPEKALRHYEIGLRIGELSLGDGFDGVLSWGLIDNRPFLRCMNGYGLCLWRLMRHDDADRLFSRMLRLNPSDNTGARFLLSAIRAGLIWKP